MVLTSRAKGEPNAIYSNYSGGLPTTHPARTDCRPSDQRGGAEEDHGFGDHLIDIQRPGDGFAAELGAQHRERNAEQHALANPDGDLAHHHAGWIARPRPHSVM
jgi:hypothetical protein